MKHVIILLLSFLSAQGIAQNADNKAVVERLFLEGWNKKEFSGFQSQLGDSVSFHLNNFHFYTNAAELVQLVDSWHNAFEDFRFEILHLVEQDDIVAVNLRYTGVQVAEFMGVPAQTNNIDVSEMMFFRFENGKLVEAWELYDHDGMINQMKGNN